MLDAWNQLCSEAAKFTQDTRTAAINAAPPALPPTYRPDDTLRLASAVANGSGMLPLTLTISLAACANGIVKPSGFFVGNHFGDA